MKALNLILTAGVLAASTAAWIEWRQANQLGREVEALHSELDRLKSEAEGNRNNLQQREQDNQKLQSQTADVLRLRNEVTRLKSGATETEKLRAENQQLRTENQKSRPGSAATPVDPAPNPTPVAGNPFAKENWAFAGYQTPESALVSALWSMKEGNPKSYLDSLSPEEQLRMAKSWQNKSEAEIAAKHQSDVSKITGMNILERSQVSADEVQLKVRIDGVDREETVRMNRVANEWKFGGYLRPPKP